MGSGRHVQRNITRHMADNVILFVIGDHGMTATGDHGGESENEVTAALFVYAKVPLIDQTQDSVKQIDLIPTLATILGIPIPYSNLGTVITSCLPLPTTKIINWTDMSSTIWANVQQMTAYIRDYSSLSTIFDTEKIEQLNIKYTILKDQFSKNINNEVFVYNCINYMSELREMCEHVWIQFDSFSMTRGLLLCFIPVFFLYTMINCLTTSQLSIIFSKSLIIFIYILTASIIIACAICYYINIISNFFTTTYFISGIAGIFTLSFILIQNWELISINWYEMSKKYQLMDIFYRFVLLASVCAFFSNSFVVQESYVSVFLLLTLISTTILDLFNVSPSKISKNIKSNFKASIKFKFLVLLGSFCVLIRFSMYYWQCRDEQNCAEFSAQKLSNTSRAQLIFALVAVGFVVTFTRMWLRYCGNLAAFNITVLFAQYAPTVITVCCGGFWVLHYLPIDGKPKSSPLWQADYLALIAYYLIIIGLLVTYFRPLTVFVISNNVNSNSQKPVKTVPQIFQEVKSLFSERSQKREEIPIICGLATAYSATFVISAVYILLLFILLLGHAVAPSAVLLYFSAGIILCISSISRYERSPNIDELLQVPTASLLTWVFLAIYFFYGTGHQPTFPNIVWEAAFVGTGGIFTSNYIPAALVIINTFGSYILIGFLLPMLQIAPFSMYAIVTSLTSKKNDEQRDVNKGDITLMENDNILLTNTFSLSCKYICCFAIRVFATMLAATIHCRHLMVWKIFAPKFIFEAISLFVTIPSVLFGYVLLIRINGAVNKLVKALNKGNR
ncbi:phosphatidylinositol glycan [Holotrichia oblita]|uniref:Phosphatidylinositol glycan n=1 Tax=Holotrichia oblita TaxID=644536 RepID=A0ACB9TMD7_HOLOL|nr:phosphatidylinositol glycan [Holotrichia oblita]